GSSELGEPIGHSASCGKFLESVLITMASRVDGWKVSLTKSILSIHLTVSLRFRRRGHASNVHWKLSGNFPITYHGRGSLSDTEQGGGEGEITPENFKQFV